VLIDYYFDEQGVEKENDVEDGRKEDSLGSVRSESWLLRLDHCLRLGVSLLLICLLREKYLFQFYGFFG
jgi:hypothetical protein